MRYSTILTIPFVLACLLPAAGHSESSESSASDCNCVPYSHQTAPGPNGCTLERSCWDWLQCRPFDISEEDPATGITTHTYVSGVWSKWYEVDDCKSQ